MCFEFKGRKVQEDEEEEDRKTDDNRIKGIRALHREVRE